MASAKKIVRNLVNVAMRVKRIDREAVASVYLSGSGIEIGALHNPLKLPASAKVQYVDRMSVPDLRKHYPELENQKLVNVNVIDDGETLATFGDASLDFVVANHFLEHSENPVGTVKNFVRVLRGGGVLYIALPDKRFSFDKDRQVTSFEHLMHDYEEGPAGSRMEHYRDWVVNVDKNQNPTEIESRVKELNLRNYSIHFHVWAQKDMVTFFFTLIEQLSLPIEIQLFLKNEGEVIFIFKKNP
jgi:SAM-dependent methyltransferase